MKILHGFSIRRWIVHLVLQTGAERQTQSSRKRDTLSPANRHLLRDVGVSWSEETRQQDGRR